MTFLDNNSGNEVSNCATALVTVSSSSLVAQVTPGGSSIHSLSKASITLSALDSYDPDTPSASLAYLWSCVRSRTGGEDEEEIEGVNDDCWVGRNEGLILTEAELVYSTVLEEDEDLLYDTLVFKVTIMATEDDRTAQAHTTLTFVSTSVPQVQSIPSLRVTAVK